MGELYTITKVEATDPISKYVTVGEIRTGTYSKKTLRVGERLCFRHENRYLSTSPIVGISDHPTDENTTIIKTTYSVYHLTKIQ